MAPAVQTKLQEIQMRSEFPGGGRGLEVGEVGDGHTHFSPTREAISKSRQISAQVEKELGARPCKKTKWRWFARVDL